MKRTFVGEPMTMAEALLLQEADLKRWESVLIPSIAAILRVQVTYNNPNVTDPYQICRGQAIYEIVVNYLMKKD